MFCYITYRKKYENMNVINYNDIIQIKDGFN